MENQTQSPATWYEIVGRYSPRICPRHRYVFHPNGRKSLKGTPGHGIDWHRTFEGARVELVARCMASVVSLQSQLDKAKELFVHCQNLTEEQCSKNN
jgi:hypothetical protein